jgi:hypothetical protein
MRIPIPPPDYMHLSVLLHFCLIYTALHIKTEVIVHYITHLVAFL